MPLSDSAISKFIFKPSCSWVTGFMFSTVQLCHLHGIDVAPFKCHPNKFCLSSISVKCPNTFVTFNTCILNE